MPQVHGLLFGTGSSAVPGEELVGLRLGRMLRPVAHTLGAVQDSTREYVGGEGITIKKS